MFQLDQAAASSVNGGGNRINESGIYDGVITRAEWSQSQSSQAAFLNLDFKSDDGKEANYMSICFQKGNGERAFGYNTMMAIMACCKLRNITQAQMGDKLVCPELTNARVTLGLQAEADWFQDKVTNEWKPTTNMQVFIPFNSETKQTAKEFLEGASSSVYGKISISDRKPKPKPEMQSQPQYDEPPMGNEGFPEGW